MKSSEMQLALGTCGLAVVNLHCRAVATAAQEVVF